MTKKDKQIYSVAAAIILIAALIAVFKTKPEGNQQQGTQQTGGQQSNGKAMNQSFAVWTGALKISDNSKKGNLMLATKDHVIYIKTSRDFSALVGKNVMVTYEGTMDNFVLGSISANPAQ